MSNPNLKAEPEGDSGISDYKKYYLTIDDAIRREDLRNLKPLVMKGPTKEDLIIQEPSVMNPPKKSTTEAHRDDETTSKARRVNLSGDPLISVLIRYHKTKLAVDLVEEMPVDILFGGNFEGDTALHVAAAEEDMEVAKAMLKRAEEDGRANELVELKNKKNEIPLHKAVLYGKKKIFWMLVKDYHSNVRARGDEGATVLHYAIMCGWFELALDIAKEYKNLAVVRNKAAVTPFQLMVTTPQAFRSTLHLGPLDSLIYDLIPLEETMLAQNKADIESLGKPRPHPGVEGRQFVPSKCPPNHATFIELLKLTYNLVTWVRVLIFNIRLLIFNILKQLFSRVESLEELKKSHKKAMELISYFAKYEGYWDFIEMGKKPEGEGSQKLGGIPKIEVNKSQGNTYSHPADASSSLPPNQEGEETQKNRDSQDSGRFRWNDSPLTLGAKMGLHEFVNQILKECPESANYTNPEGQNVLQVAIQNGHERIVNIVESLTCNKNPVLPSWLLSKREDGTNNTILHFAAETTIKGGASALQVQYELQWFERVKKLVPRDLLNSRNKEELTAQELFTKKHEKMVLDSRDQLRDIGKTCSGLLAAVVFATSFSIPQNGNDQNLLKMTAFNVFAHAYVIGLSCAATALVLFLSLLTAQYKEEEFRRSLPTKYFFAMTSFYMAFLCLLVAFFCNIYLSIYGGNGKVIVLAIELIAVPVICFIVLFYRGCSFGIRSFFRQVWH